jgi:hypothetical protein
MGAAAVIPIHEARARRAGGQPTPDVESIAQRVAAGERLYTAAELGRLLGGRSAKSLQRDRALGMPKVAVGNHYRYVLADVLAWQEQRREAAASSDQSCA